MQGEGRPALHRSDRAAAHRRLCRRDDAARRRRLYLHAGRRALQPHAAHPGDLRAAARAACRCCGRGALPAGRAAGRRRRRRRLREPEHHPDPHRRPALGHRRPDPLPERHGRRHAVRADPARRFGGRRFRTDTSPQPSVARAAPASCAASTRTIPASTRTRRPTAVPRSSTTNRPSRHGCRPTAIAPASSANT